MHCISHNYIVTSYKTHSTMCSDGVKNGYAVPSCQDLINSIDFIVVTMCVLQRRTVRICDNCGSCVMRVTAIITVIAVMIATAVMMMAA